MEDQALIQLWKEYNNQMEENLQLNRNNAVQILEIKIKSTISSLKPVKIFAVFVGILWVIFIDSILYITFNHANSFFLVSAIMQVVLTKIAIGIYIYQLAIIDKVEVENDVVSVQEKIAKLQSSTLWVARLMFLQLPVWTTFYWNTEMLSNNEYLLYIAQLVATIALSILSIWLFLNINMENRQKKWFKLLFEGKEWNASIQALEMLNQINQFKKTDH
jgi:uncharacterized membrane protein